MKNLVLYFLLISAVYASHAQVQFTVQGNESSDNVVHFETPNNVANRDVLEIELPTDATSSQQFIECQRGSSDRVMAVNGDGSGYFKGNLGVGTDDFDDNALTVAGAIEQRNDIGTIFKFSNENGSTEFGRLSYFLGACELRNSVNSSLADIILVTNDGVFKLEEDGRATISGGGAVNPGGSMLNIRQRDNFAGIGVRNEADGFDVWEMEVGINDFEFNFNNGSSSGNTMDRIAFIDDADGSFNANSDQRLKRDIEYLEEDILERFLRLRPVNYRFNHTTGNVRKTIGLIAQEVKAIFPELVKSPEKSDGYLSMNYDEIAIYAIKAIQEQQAIIEKERNDNDKSQAIINRLDADNQQLNKRLEALENHLANQQTLPQITTPLPVTPKNPQEILVEDQPQLQQNFPNPFHQQTEIQYYLPPNVHAAQLLITDQNGRTLKSYPLVGQGVGKIKLNGGQLAAGIYAYTLLIDGKIIDTKQMVLTK